MAKKGTMPVDPIPVAGVTHFATKQATAPKTRQNMYSIRTGPMKRMTTPVKPLKADKPNNYGKF